MVASQVTIFAIAHFTGVAISCLVRTMGHHRRTGNRAQCNCDGTRLPTQGHCFVDPTPDNGKRAQKPVQPEFAITNGAREET
jgi:hypothetical protein